MVAWMRRSVNGCASGNADCKRVVAIELSEGGDYNGRPMRRMRQVLHLAAVGLFVAVGSMFVGCVPPETNRPPVASFRADPREGYAPLTVLLDATGTYDPDGDVLSYEWIFEGGETAGGRTILHRFEGGTHQVTLRVSDARGGIDEATEVITARPVLDGYVVRTYEWIYEGEERVWNALLSYDLYQIYRGRLRTSYAERYEYGDYVLDPLDDPTLEELAGVLWNRAQEDPEAFIEWTLAFVQGGIGYQPDPPGQEWPLYPIETLVDMVGDCEDTAILFVSLLRAEGVSSRLATVDTDDDGNPDHVLALVPVTADHAGRLTCAGGGTITVLELDGDLHAVAETAVESGALGLGCDPWDLEEGDVIETWSF